MSLILGIDPGLDGALAFLDTCRATLKTFAMPTFRQRRNGKVKRILDEAQITKLVAGHRPDIAWVEDVYSSPQMGVTSAFTFGEAKGILKGILAACHIPCRYIAPSKWKQDLGVSADKLLAKARAHRLFPACVSILTNDGKAEAALIALYGALADNTVPNVPIVPAD